MLESLLIDLNEEVFSISEELARSYGQQEKKSVISARAREFQMRAKELLKKISKTVD